ncbi:hypothetical protein [Paenibacillus sp. 1001270B_150601_E10]|uniref:hypothetical protein n=1 Tax=Paenibacillus sp. 1001270B_150601_E10 TaxID=2787079 RepID=UPI001E4826F3|nr:hypothetical protein [Paenibacillus sp. 1001270B_150601_E10]
MEPDLQKEKEEIHMKDMYAIELLDPQVQKGIETTIKYFEEKKPFFIYPEDTASLPSQVSFGKMNNENNEI